MEKRALDLFVSVCMYLHGRGTRQRVMFARTPVLRVKRERSDDAVDTVQVRVPAKRRRLAAKQGTQHGEQVEHVVFRRVQLQQHVQHILHQQDTRIIELNCGPSLSQLAHAAAHAQSQAVVCNDVAMTRFELPRNRLYRAERARGAVEHDDVQDSAMYDVFVLQSERSAREETGEREDEKKLLCIDADEIDLFESDDDDDNDNNSAATSDVDAHSIDYPSTPPQHSDHSASSSRCAWLSYSSSSSSPAAAAALDGHGSRCTLHCACGLGMRDGDLRAYDGGQHLYDDSDWEV